MFPPVLLIKADPPTPPTAPNPSIHPPTIIHPGFTDIVLWGHVT